jgi:hypothetical protein
MLTPVFMNERAGSHENGSVKPDMVKPSDAKVMKMHIRSSGPRIIQWPLSARFALNPFVSLVAQ